MFLTVVARQCPSYTDITANRARNNIMESLRDLGVDTPYRAGEPVDPITEARVQPNCTPIVGWHFTLGTGYVTRAVSGDWGSLSIVTGAFSPTVVTQDSVPLLDAQARETGDRIAGAATIELTHDQAALAATSSTLWIQGGTPSDPILNQLFPDLFGFGALRCALDNLNGDNVEFISYPSSAKHVFCFAYYVTPPPTAGTIIVRKEVAGGTEGDTFNFGGNISFNPGGAYTLTARPSSPGSVSFIRGETKEGEGPWIARELQTGGWNLTGLTCTSSSGRSATTTDLAARQAEIRLAAEDTVTCTFVDSRAPPPPPIKPIALSVSCVANHDSTFDAVFVWENPNDSEVSIPVGAETNSVSPGGPDRGQPSTFAADSSGEFTLAGVPNGETASWTLTQDGVESHAEVTDAFSEKCPEEPPPPPPPVKPIALSVSCVANHDTTFDLVFVWENPNDSEVSIPVGAETNSVSPGGPDRGQPSTFAANASGEFTLAGVPNGQTASWTLTQDGVESHAEGTDAFSEKCPEPPPPPPMGGLVIEKVTHGGVGRFDFTIRPVAGGQSVTSTATTEQQGVPATATPGEHFLPPGQYEIDEKAPPRPGGHWIVSAVECGGSVLPARLPARVTLTAGTSTLCRVSNTLVHRGSIVLYKVSLDGVGTSGFAVNPAADQTTRFVQRVTTAQPNVRNRAHGDNMSRLPLGSYVIKETETSPGRALGAVVCNGEPLPFSASSVLVHLTPGNRHVECDFVNVAIPLPDPDPVIPPPDIVYPSTDIRITKTVDRRRIRLGQILTYTIHVVNRGNATADLVTVRDQLNLDAVLVSARPSSGHCIERLPLNCVIRSIDPGKTATIVVRVRPLRTGRLSNTVVSGLATVDPVLSNNRDVVKAMVVRPRPRRPVKPPFTG